MHHFTVFILPEPYALQFPHESFGSIFMLGKNGPPGLTLCNGDTNFNESVFAEFFRFWHSRESLR